MSDYLAQVVRQRDAALERAKRAEQLLAAAEDELQKRRAGTPLICSDERHQQKVAALEAELAKVQKRAELLQAGAYEREDLLTEARDLLEPWGGHGDGWPSLAPAIEALIGRLNQALQPAKAAP